MVPRINRLDFFTSKSGLDIVQLVGEASDRIKPDSFSKQEIELISKRVKLCELLASITFRIDSYGLINYLVEEGVKELLEYLRLSIEVPDFKRMISFDYIDEGLNLYQRRLKKFQNLEATSDDYEIRISNLAQEVNAKNHLFQDTKNVGDDIKQNPSKYCLDEAGNIIENAFTGRLQRYYPNGNLMKDYQFKNGLAQGEGLNYDIEGNREVLVLFHRGEPIQRSKKWYKNGQLELERSGKTEKGWYASGGLKYKKDFVDNTFTGYYENGKLKMKSNNAKRPNQGKKERWDENGNKLY